MFSGESLFCELFSLCFVDCWPKRNSTKVTVKILYIGVQGARGTGIVPAVVRAPPPPGGVLQEKLGGAVCGPFPKSPTLFMTKISDIPYPIYDRIQNSRPYL